MIDNRERRGIVDNLKTSVEIRENWENVTDSLLLDILAADLRYDYDEDFELWLFNRLAELIERKTCHDLSQYNDTFICSNCKTEMYIITDIVNEYGQSFGVPLLPQYCPNCGAEVIE